MAHSNFLSESEEADLREKYGYNDEDIKTYSEGKRTIKCGEELIAMAAHAAWHRRNPKGPDGRRVPSGDSGSSEDLSFDGNAYKRQVESMGSTE